MAQYFELITPITVTLSVSLCFGSQSERLRVDGGVTVKLGGRVVRFEFEFGSWGRHTGELRGLRVSLPDSAEDLQPRKAELRVSQRRVIGLGVGGKVAGKLSRFA